MKNTEIIVILFEGYFFNVEVEYHSTIVGLFLVKIDVKNTANQFVNKQAFSHTLGLLREKICDGEYDREIKLKIIRKIRLKESKETIADGQNKWEYMFAKWKYIFIALIFLNIFAMFLYYG